ncbi:MAG: cytochrome c biogenesis protein CcdA [Ilumatobacteraceae bacterium]
MNGVLLPFAAIAAGVVSASSPCVLPVLPGYIAAVSATDGSDAGLRPRARILGAFGFVAGFTMVFTILGATASALGGLLYDQLDIALRVAGVVLIVFGLHTLGVLRWSALAGERRPVEMHSVGRGPRRAAALGAVFALGWTPCIGPILATVLTLAANEASMGAGVRLLVVYSLGLGIPFILAAVAIGPFLSFMRRFKRHFGTMEKVMGLLLGATGILFLLGGQNWFGQWMLETFPSLARIEDWVTSDTLKGEILKKGGQ